MEMRERRLRRTIMDAAPERRRWKKDMMRSFRLNQDLLESMEAECRARHISLSECVRPSDKRS